ncbi:MAG TPA: hypothetical protein VEA80_01350 [Vitreimonas sp.]|uniref:hypothetical protein n=1 Tax=Vitreimonas sp. TaxID=3069702 RepID=UPI002D384FEC|nr:hypothetical protein [Vitreimonas sp.]HYD86097.1 hypothetical protein [Vitreimonas sp.]
MAIYRATLVWALRAAAAIVLALAAFSAVRAVVIYDNASASLEPGELAYVPTPADIALQVVPAAGLALLSLALAEILAMQLRSARKS